MNVVYLEPHGYTIKWNSNEICISNISGISEIIAVTEAKKENRGKFFLIELAFTAMLSQEAKAATAWKVKN